MVQGSEVQGFRGLEVQGSEVQRFRVQRFRGLEVIIIFSSYWVL
jgi:hypothetical protein